MNGLPFDISAQIDKSYLERVQQGFGDASIPMDILFFIVILVASAVVLLFLGNLFNKYRDRIFGKKKSLGDITSARKIQSILEEALEQRTKVEMQFAPANPSRRSISCTLMDVGEDTMLMELPHSIRPSRSWLEREIVCFFRVQEKKEQIVHYAFTTTIAGVRRLPGDFIQLRVMPPSRLTLHQKRAYLRITPPTHYILGLAVWTGSWVTNPKRINFIRSWGTPTFRFSPSKRVKSVQMENISAGGVRLTIPNEALRRVKADLDIGHKLILLIEMFDPDHEKRRIFWLQGTIKNSYEDFTTKNLELGIQFTRVGVAEDKENQKVRWNTLGPEGVESIAGWVMKRHLEMYRRTGLS